MASKKDYYDILGVSKNATQDEIKSAFRKKAKTCHPDINKTPEAEAQFKELGEAYSVLGDEQKRKQYDQFGSAAFDNNAGGFGGFQGNYQNYSFDDIDLGDLFSDFFGGSAFGFGNKKKKNRPVRGSDSLVRMELEFMEAAFGAKKTIHLNIDEVCPSCDGLGGHDAETCSECNGRGKTITVQRTILGAFQTETVCSKCGGSGKTFKNECHNCRGTGRVNEEKEIVVTIPEGVNSHDKIRLSGKGEAGYNGGENGDLYIEFIVEEHPLFKRDENDIYLELPLTITEAILGCKKEIPTLTDNVLLTIKEGTQNNDKYKLKGKGIKSSSRMFKGDLYVICKIIIPTKLTGTQKRLFKELDDTDLDSSSEFKKFKSYLN